MVQRDNCGNQFFERQDAISEALIVMYKIKLTGALSELALDTSTECRGFAKCTGQEKTKFVEIFASLEFPDGGEAEGIVVVDEVEAWQLGEFDAVVHDRIRLTAEDFDAMAKVNKCFSEVTGIDALTTDMGFTAVGEVSDL